MNFRSNKHILHRFQFGNSFGVRSWYIDTHELIMQHRLSCLGFVYQHYARLHFNIASHRIHTHTGIGHILNLFEINWNPSNRISTMPDCMRILFAVIYSTPLCSGFSFHISMIECNISTLFKSINVCTTTYWFSSGSVPFHSIRNSIHRPVALCTCTRTSIEQWEFSVGRKVVCIDGI